MSFFININICFLFTKKKTTEVVLFQNRIEKQFFYAGVVPGVIVTFAGVEIASNGNLSVPTPAVFFKI